MKKLIVALSLSLLMISGCSKTANNYKPTSKSEKIYFDYSPNEQPTEEVSPDIITPE